MWRGRGVRFPRSHGWPSGRPTGAESAVPACAQGERRIGSMGVLRVFARPAEIQSLDCHDIPANPNQRNLFLSESAMPHSALARGPPEDPLALLSLKNGFAQICCNDKEI